jgi:molybdopterin biosynthesis enzyme
MGLNVKDCLPKRMKLPLAADYQFHSERETFVPARLEWRKASLKARVLRMKGSADMVGFSRGNVMAVFPIGKKTYRAGELIDIQLLDHFLIR